ncbi:DNA damage-binding protein 1 [Camellia lanceoleosa]|nr:DNA damage-binding protein 1 [Camellia lanceoleosa]
MDTSYHLLLFCFYSLSFYVSKSRCHYSWRDVEVFFATGGGHVVYLEIGDGISTEVKHAQLEYDISCLDINPIGENPNCSQLAAVGMWTDISVRIFSLPDLNLITKENLGGEIIPRFVLLRSFEGISYLLCALGDGHHFLLNMSTGELTDRKKVSLGTQPITLRTFSSKMKCPAL